MSRNEQAVKRVDQGMAVRAAEVIGTDSVTDELRTRYRRLPAMLHTSGLAATYAYVASKSVGGGELPKAYERVAKAIRDQLDVSETDPADVLTRLGDLSVTEYATATARVRELAGWLSRLATAKVEQQQRAQRHERAGEDDA